MESKQLPPEFKCFHNIFLKANAKTPPSLPDSYHAIIIKKGSLPPWGPIYPLSISELKALREYLDDNLASSRI
jgi:hypothetical protein